jgi:hypothetical protein
MTDPQDGAPHGPPPGERAYWLDSKANVDRLVRGFYVLCAFLFAIDVLVPKHGQFDIEHRLGFYAIFGFVACVALVLTAKVLRILIMRPEDYYDR